MKISALIDVSLLLATISERGFSGIDDASRACGVAPSTMKKLLAGDCPKIVALRRVCEGLNLDIRELVISASTHKEKSGSGRRVLPGRWPGHSIARNDG